jgi:hypothetical protein
MPATRVTVALNAKQSQKAPLLVPACASIDPLHGASIRALVFKAAQSKLRLKKPLRIYVGGTGHELLTEEDWKHNIRDDVVLLVSGGEEFVGVKRESNVHSKSLRGLLSTFALQTSVHQMSQHSSLTFGTSTSQPSLCC